MTRPWVLTWADVNEGVWGSCYYGPAWWGCGWESAGINRHEGGDGRALRRRASDPRRPQVMRRRPVRAWRSVDRGTCRPGYRAAKSESGVLTLSNRWKATLLPALSRAGGGPCAVKEPWHARNLQGAALLKVGQFGCCVAMPPGVWVARNGCRGCAVFRV